MQAGPSYVRSDELLSRHDSRLLIVDVQEKLLPFIPVRDALIFNCRQLILAAQILDVPVAATEQYRKGLGPTAPELAELLGDIPDKFRFSCAEVLAWSATTGVAAAEGSACSAEPAGGAAAGAPVLAQGDRDKVVVAGMEAHVCVQQTVLDLLAQGFRVYIPADAVASRKKFDWEIALRRMSDSGAIVTTTEAVLFEWCEVAGTPEFKQISELVKARPR